MADGNGTDPLGRAPQEAPGLEGPIWIFGSSRSGSTWLLKMLRELPGVATIDDPHLGHHLGIWRPISLAWGVGEVTPALRRLDQIKGGKNSYFFNRRYEHVWKPALRGLVAARFLAEADDQVGAARRALVVKEPGSQAAPLMLSLFRGARLVFLLRDGRDVVDSWIDAYRNGSWAIEEGAFAAAEDRREALVRWQASVWAYRTRAVREAYEAHEPARRVLVRYEDLLDDPVRELSRICATAQIAVSRTELERIASAHDFEGLPSRGRGREQRAASPGSWRTNLTRREQEAMHAIMGEELSRSGYLEDAAGRTQLAATA
jgi:hypothetical protein